MKEKLFFWIKILGLAGVILAAYLLWEQAHPSNVPFCTVSSTINCNAVISGEVSKMLGIPTPLIGLAGYIVILFGVFRRKTKLILGAAAFGLAFCLYVGGIEILILHVVCPVCILCLTDMVVLFTLSVFLNRKTSESLPK